MFILTQSQKYLELWNHWDFLSLQKSFILLTNIMEGIKKDVILWGKLRADPRCDLPLSLLLVILGFFLSSLHQCYSLRTFAHLKEHS